MVSKTNDPYSQRLEKHEHPLAKLLFEIADMKKSNLVVEAEFTTSEELLKCANGKDPISRRQQSTLKNLTEIGPYITVLKTHVDMVQDRTDETIPRLTEAAENHQFLLMEDLKFGNIDNTVKKLPVRIWGFANIVTVSILNWDGIVEDLSQVIFNKDDDRYWGGRALVLIGHIPPAGHSVNYAHKDKCYEVAKNHPEIVIGFVDDGDMSRMGCLPKGTEPTPAPTETADTPTKKADTPTETTDEPAETAAELTEKIRAGPEDFLIFAPGVHKEKKGANLDYEYQTPTLAINFGADFIIVGESICKARDRVEAAESYQEEGWKAYENRTKRWSVKEPQATSEEAQSPSEEAPSPSEEGPEC
jgi:orotidine-5'-phosphate decarboxylase